MNRTAREATYLHWHRAVRCQEKSQANAITASMRFFCESISKDAIKGEMHYVSYDSPPMVFVADGRTNAYALDARLKRALVLAVDGHQLAFEDDDSVNWIAEYYVSGDLLSSNQH